MKRLFKILSMLGAMLPAVAVASQPTYVLSYSYASGTVNSTAYVQLVGSTAVNTNRIELCDSSTQLVKIAFGASGSQVDRYVTSGSGCIVLDVYPTLVSGSTIWLKAVGASATSGWDVLSLFP